MKEISIEELKRLQLEILQAVHIFCEKNKITYFLGYGSLIGAIRHKGYIPWDDDIDIMMLREDYNRFLQLFNGAVANLEVFAPELNCEYYAPYANVINRKTVLIEKGTSHRGVEMGVKIDVFPIDSVPSDFEKYCAYSRKMEKLNDILRYKRRRIRYCVGFKSKCKTICNKILYSIISYGKIQKKIMSLVNKENDKKSIYVDLIVFPVYKKKRYERSLLDSTIKVEFEGLLFNAPIGYDSILRSIYGDYMQLPPKDKQITHHGFTAYWKD